MPMYRGTLNICCTIKRAKRWNALLRRISDATQRLKDNLNGKIGGTLSIKVKSLLKSRVANISYFCIIVFKFLHDPVVHMFRGCHTQFCLRSIKRQKTLYVTRRKVQLFITKAVPHISVNHASFRWQQNSRRRLAHQFVALVSCGRMADGTPYLWRHFRVFISNVIHHLLFQKNKSFHLFLI